VFDPPVPIDAGAPPSAAPRVDLNSDGDGAAVAEASGTATVGSLLDKRTGFQPAQRLDGGSAGPESPDVSATDRGDVAAAWRVLGADGVWHARARFREAGGDWGPDTPVSRDDLGSVNDPGVAIGGDRVGDFAVAMVQGGAARTLVVTVFDRPPGAPSIAATQRYKRPSNLTLRWRPGLELWGPQTFRVLIDGAPIGETQATTFVPAKVRSGKHRWQVEAVDRAGQAVRSRAQTLRVDASPPSLRVTVRGRRRAGVPLRIVVRARDRGATGLDHVTVAYGDHSARTHALVSRHAYRRGRFTLKVAAVDRAGNVGRKRVRLRIR